MFRTAFGCAQHPKAGRNTQQILRGNYSGDLNTGIIQIHSVGECSGSKAWSEYQTKSIFWTLNHLTKVSGFRMVGPFWYRNSKTPVVRCVWIGFWTSGIWIPTADKNFQCTKFIKFLLLSVLKFIKVQIFSNNFLPRFIKILLHTVFKFFLCWPS